MEKKDFRDHLERLSQHFATELITYRQAWEYLGTTRKLLDRDKTFPKKRISGRYYVSLVGLAKWLS